MKTLKKQIADQLSILINQNFGAVISNDEIIALMEYPPDPSMGDIAIPCFKLAKALKKSPVIIASSIADSLTMPVIEKAEALNGYLNIFLYSCTLSSHVLDEIKNAGENYGSPMNGDGKTVVLDYSSPNVAKPFHIGHLGTTVIGHSLKLLHEFAGYKCVGINHLGDWGTQFGKLIVAYRKWGSKEAVEQNEIDELVALYVRFHKEAELNPELENEARTEFTKLEHHDEENLALWRWFIEISIREYKKTYGQLGIEFDSYNGESFYTDKMPEQIQKMKEINLLKIDDGASVVDLEEYGMPPCLILKRDGSTLYPTRDIAAAVYRKRHYDFEKCIYVTSAGQSLHFAQWFKVLEMMGYDWHDGLVHIPYGTVSINGEKLATRTGNVILLKDLFAMAIEKVGAIMDEKNPDIENKAQIAEAVGVGAIVFHYLSNNRMRDINFMLEDALTFDGNTGPYAQYTYARCCSILEKASDIDYSSFSVNKIGEEEKDLAKVLSKFPEKIDEALADYEPSVITRYILDLCASFNRFYHNCSILGADDVNEKKTRLAFTCATRQVLGTALRLICLKTPEKI